MRVEINSNKGGRPEGPGGNKGPGLLKKKDDIFVAGVEDHRGQQVKKEGDPLTDSLNEVQESQMFKELFSSNLSSSGRKIRVHGVQHENRASSGLSNGLKLVSELKN